LQQFIISRDRPEDDLRKWCRDGRFARKTNAEAHGYEIHQGLTADLEFLYTGIMIAIGQPSRQAVTECRVALGLTNNEALIAKIAPFDLFLLTQRVMFREDNENPFIPERKGFATVSIARIHDECHVKLSPPNSYDVVSGCALDNLNADVGVL
jgi:hypothetical protein